METKYNVSAKNITTYGGNGILKELYFPENIDEVVDLYDKKDNIHILGGGSNTIILDGINNANVVSFKHLDGIVFDGEKVIVGAGVRLSRLMRTVREYDFGGLEFMMGVPATIGGLVKMNAGAFGQEIGVYVDKIVSLSADNEIIEILPPYNFGYRKGYDGVILQVEFHLERVAIDKSIERENEYKSLRSLRQPKGRSAGSVFKNVGQGAGYYIDKAGLKGTIKGGAQISSMHGNFIVNMGGGSASDYLYLVSLAKEKVYNEFGVQLTEEFKVLGEV